MWVLGAADFLSLPASVMVFFVIDRKWESI